MGDKSEILQGTLDLMVLKTLEAMGPMHGYGLARRIEQLSEDERVSLAREIARILRPGGRVVVLGGGEPTGFVKLLSKGPASPLVLSGEMNTLLTANGFGIVRTLAEREGLVFIEGLKPRTPVTL